MLGDIGVMLHTGDMPMEEISRYAQAAESLGYEGFWITEESGKEGFAVPASVARDTQRIKLGTSILNFYSRTPTLPTGLRKSRMKNMLRSFRSKLSLLDVIPTKS